jgi:hypothetical protein
MAVVRICRRRVSKSGFCYKFGSLLCKPDKGCAAFLAYQTGYVQIVRSRQNIPLKWICD